MHTIDLIGRTNTVSVRFSLLQVSRATGRSSETDISALQHPTIVERYDIDVLVCFHVYRAGSTLDSSINPTSTRSDWREYEVEEDLGDFPIGTSSFI